MVFTKVLSIIHGNVSNAVDFICKELHLDLSCFDEICEHFLRAKGGPIVLAAPAEVSVQVALSDMMPDTHIV